MKIFTTIKKQGLLILALLSCHSALAQWNGQDLDINNIRARINPTGSNFWNGINGAGATAIFEVPKGSGKNSIFTGGLWIGGLDNGGNLHGSAQTYAQGNISDDFDAGPIDISTNTPASPANWDKVFKVSKATILYHRNNWNIVGYTVPQEIADWPGTYTFPSGSTRVLAPFADYNNNGVYDPQNGDYPYIMGDQAIYSIFNDFAVGQPLTQGLEVGVEVHAMFYAFDNPSDYVLNNTVFARYQIKNFSSNSYSDFYTGLWHDFDLGDPLDDYCGTNVGESMVYIYNSDNDDGSGIPYGYGLNPPSQGCIFLSPLLTNSISYENINSVAYGNPEFADDYYLFTESVFRDSVHQTFGSNGYDPGSSLNCNFAFPGITDPLFPGQDWSAGSAGIVGSDVRMIGSTGPVGFNAGDLIKIDLAYPFAAGGVSQLDSIASALRVMYNAGQITAIDKLPDHTDVNLSLEVYPNPLVKNQSVDVVTNDNLSGKISISDITGKIILTADKIIKHQKLNVDLKRGMYLITYTSPAGSVIKKLTVK